MAVFIGFFMFFLSMLTLVQLYAMLLAAGFGIAPGEMSELIEKLPDFTSNELMFYRLRQGGTQVLSWGLIGGIMAVAMGGFYQYLDLDKKALAGHYVLAIVVILVCIPFVQFLTFNSETFSLPETFAEFEAAARKAETQNQGLIFAVLKEKGAGILLLNILVIAVAPAFCEEIFFRGFLQKTFGKVWNIHTGIWLSALLFSVIHFQFYGFFSRLFLGALLGYLVYGSGSLWPAIAGHFVFNLVNILMVYGVYNLGWADESYLENTVSMPAYLTIMSILAVAGLFFVYFRMGRKVPHFSHSET